MNLNQKIKVLLLLKIKCFLHRSHAIFRLLYIINCNVLYCPLEILSMIAIIWYWGHRSFKSSFMIQNVNKWKELFKFCRLFYFHLCISSFTHFLVGICPISQFIGEHLSSGKLSGDHLSGEHLSGGHLSVHHTRWPIKAVR